MRTVTRWFGLVMMMFVLVGVPALANPARGGTSATPKVHGPKAAAATSSKVVTSPNGTAVKSSTVKTHGPSAGPKTTSKVQAVKPAKSTTPKGNSATAKTKNGTTTSSNTTSGSTTTSSGGTGSTVNGATWTPTNAVAQKLSTKSNILKKVQTTLGTVDLNGATAGFKNFGQFVAAINVSNNHHIAFADLKAAMTGMDMFGQPVLAIGTTGATSGTTPVTTMSLGQAIQTLKPGVDAETVAQTAVTQANQEINSSTTTSTSTASTSTTGTKAKPKSKS